MILNAILSFFWNIIRHFAAIADTDSPLSKTDLLFNYLKLKFQYIFLEKIPGRKKKNTKIFGKYITCADLHTVIRLYEEIFIRNIYFFKAKDKRPKILDCGSHIGMSVIYFKLIYPQSTILAFEPEKETFEILQKNIFQNKLKDVVVKNNALYSHNGDLLIYIKNNNPASGTGGIIPRNGYSPEKVQAVTLSKYMGTKVDYLKMDIEGAEMKVFADLDKNKKLRFVEKLTLEYHHHLQPQEDKLSKILKVLENNNFGYLVNAYFPSNASRQKVQDIIIHAYQK